MSRIDLCAKLTEQIMPMQPEHVAKGRVWGGCHLHAIGSLNNKPFSDKVGRQSPQRRDKGAAKSFKNYRNPTKVLSLIVYISAIGSVLTSL